MDYLLFMILYSVIFLLIVFGIIIPIKREHRKATGNVVNYDSSMRKFVYKIYMSKEEIINALKIRNSKDDLSCTFDFERFVIRFSEAEYGSNGIDLGEYFFEIHECYGFSILRLNQVHLITMRNNLTLRLNPFFKSKLDAEIVPFTHYGF